MKTFLTKLAGLLLISATILILTGCPKETDMPEEQGAWVTRIFTEDKEEDLANNDFFSIDAETQTVRFYFDAGMDTKKPFSKGLSLFNEDFLGFECIISDNSNYASGFTFDFYFVPEEEIMEEELDEAWYTLQFWDHAQNFYLAKMNIQDSSEWDEILTDKVTVDDGILSWATTDTTLNEHGENTFKVRTRTDGAIEITVNGELLETIVPPAGFPNRGKIILYCDTEAYTTVKYTDISFKFTKFQVLPD